MQLVVDVLDLERLAQVGDELAGLGRRAASNRSNGSASLTILRHLGLDGRKVVLGEAAAVDLDVVVEAVRRGGPEGELHAGEEPHDGPGHDVRRRVAQDVERLAVLGGQDPQLDRAGRAVPFSSGRSRSTTVPLATAATAASASRLPMPAATSRGRTPSGYSLIEPSGSLIWSIVDASPSVALFLSRAVSARQRGTPLISPWRLYDFFRFSVERSAQRRTARTSSAGHLRDVCKK